MKLISFLCETKKELDPFYATSNFDAMRKISDRRGKNRKEKVKVIFYASSSFFLF